ncbi:MAG: fatty acid desaturase [Bacteroidota bacterium]|nr:fatty acid desaturase [Bacteroidota bacterium]
MLNQTIEISDPVTKSTVPAIDKLFLKYINDERDLPFIYLIAKIFIFVIPIAILFYWLPEIKWYWAPVYYIYQIVFFTGPFILMLHLTSHRLMFKRDYNWLNKIIPWIIGPFFGETPESYYAHHVGMHHPENNLMDDTSSTMKYQRDSFIDFMKYYGTFITIGLYQLYQYLTFKKKIHIRKDLVTGETTFYIFCAIMCFFNWQATMVVFIIPVFVTRFLMMAGNWGQHAFIDPSEPENSYKNSITCINSPYNVKCWNDGYHIGHHLKPAMHWTELPVEFKNNFDKYIQNQALVFKKIDFFMVWLFLMLKQYKWLMSFYVEINYQNPKSESETIALMKQRTQKFALAS